MYRFHIKTGREGFYEITAKVREALLDSHIHEGICVVYSPHTTAGITINENADPDVRSDLLYALDKTFTDEKAFRHMEGNSASHMKASVLGSSATIMIEDGNLVLGTWQGIYFCEFDGPRDREYYIKLIGEKNPAL